MGPSSAPSPKLTLRGALSRGDVVVAIVSFVYAVWLGAQWLKLPPSSEEIPLYASRVWDMQREIAQTGHIAWWTSTFMMGSSNALPYTSFPLVPWFFLAKAFGLLLPGKLLVLASIFACGPSMYYLARRFVRSELGATFAALAYLLHSHVIFAGTNREHVSVVMFMAFLPLAWLTFARALDRGRFADVFACALTLMLLLWTQNKLAMVQAPFLLAYGLWDLARAGKGRRAVRIRTGALVLTFTLLASMFFLVPALGEMKLLKLFENDPFDGWQKMYSLSDLGGLVTRKTEAGSYFGIVLTLVCLVACFGARRRADVSFFVLLVVLMLASIALGHGPKTVGTTLVHAWLGDEERYWTAATYWSVACGVLLVVGGSVALFLRKRLTSLWGRIFAIAGAIVFWFFPCFDILSSLPLFKQIRAPEIFSQEPLEFFGALVAGFFVTDVIEPWLESKVVEQRIVVAVLAVAFVVDGWPFASRVRESDMTQAYVDRLKDVIAQIGAEAKTEGGRVMNETGRAIWLMGPAWGGPPLANEAHLRYMAPRGSGLLQAVASSTPPFTRAFFELAGVHWEAIEKGVGWTQGHIDYDRSNFLVNHEDDDTVVFHIATAHPYLTGYTQLAAEFGEPNHLPNLALLLAGNGYLLVDAPPDRRPEYMVPEELESYSIIYIASPPKGPLLQNIGSKTYLLQEERPPPLPPSLPFVNAISDVLLERPSAERIEAKFTAHAGCMAVFQESYYPYWTARLDGQRTDVQRVASAFLGIQVTEGQHEIVLTYEPPGEYTVAIFVSLATLLLGTFRVISDWRTRRVAPPADLDHSNA